MSFTATLPAYLPDASYFIQFLPCRFVLIADHVQFQKRSAITRNSIAPGIPALSVPVQHNGYKKPIYQKEIAFIENWNFKHLKTIHHKFNTAPYFDDYFPEIEQILKNTNNCLTDFLTAFLNFFLKRLKIGSTIVQTSSLNFTGKLEDNLIDFAKSNDLHRYYLLQKDADARQIDTSKLNGAHIETCIFPKLKSPQIAEMNILDFLFQYGPEASFIIRDL